MLPKLNNSSAVVYLRAMNSKNFKMFLSIQKRTKIGKLNVALFVIGTSLCNADAKLTGADNKKYIFGMFPQNTLCDESSIQL
jgi:hypothetical protein